MFGFLKKKNEQTEWVGGEVHVNPSDRRRKVRNAARMERLKMVLREKNIPAARRRAFEDELKKRGLLREIDGEV